MMPDSLIFRWWIWMRFDERDWSANEANDHAFAEALSGTATWAHLGRISSGGRVSKPHGGIADVKKAFAEATARCALLSAGKKIYDENATAWIELEISPRSGTLTAAIKGAPLAELGSRALDDFFLVARRLHDALGDRAHVIEASAAIDWDGAAPRERRTSDWPLDRIADVLEPTRPPQDPGNPDDDVFLTAAKAIAEATPPAGVARSTHGRLIELRWTSDPSDATAADAATVKHAAWMRDLVKNEILV